MTKYMMIFIESKYTLTYYRLIARARTRTDFSLLVSHHIVPESFYKVRKRKGPAGWLDGDPDAPENLIYLTQREHFIAHRLLVRMTTGKAKRKMALALRIMRNTMNKDGQKVRLTSREYEVLRLAQVESNLETSKDEAFCKAVSDALNRPETKAKFTGDNNCMKRPEIRKSWEDAMERTRDKYLAVVKSAEHSKKMSESTIESWKDPSKKANLVAALAKPETRALKSKIMSGSNNPMFDHRVFMFINEAQGRVEIGTLSQIAARLGLVDIRSLKRSMSSKVPTRYGWSFLG